MERKGFHVPCNTDLDCFSRCGTHPVSGMHYVCTKNVSFYTTAGYSKDAYKAQVAANAQLRASGEPHQARTRCASIVFATTPWSVNA